MSEQMLAYCGLDCGECPAYIAHRTDDQDLRVKMTKEWGSDDFPLSPEDINCDGCTSDSDLKFAFCGQCAVRACATEKGHETCAVCTDYGCEKLEAFFKMAGDESRTRLQQLRDAFLSD